MTSANEPILRVSNLCRTYVSRAGILAKKREVQAVKNVSFSIERGQTLAIVGESGCGKSTLARMLTFIDTPTSGDIFLDGQNISLTKRAAVTSEIRKKVQMVFQNPYSSLNPRQKIGAALEEPLLINSNMSRAERREQALDMLNKVGLAAEHYNRYPHMFSGGQRQRIAIARALMLRPRLLILDEPVSALDLSVQAQVLNLLKDLQEELQLTYIFISHDLSVVKYLADKVLVMYFGQVREYGAKEEVFANPQDDYTKTLFAAIPKTDVEHIRQRLQRKKSSQLG